MAGCCNIVAASHPSVTFGDSSPQGEPHSCRGEHCSPARIPRRRQTPRANTVRPYTPLPIGPVGRGLDPSFAILLLLKVARGVEDAAPYERPHGGCRGEHCSPAKISRCRQIPGRIWNPPLRTTQKPQQTIEIANRPIVECWPRAGASPSALGFLRARLRSVRAKREPKRP